MDRENKKLKKIVAGTPLDGLFTESYPTDRERLIRDCEQRKKWTAEELNFGYNLMVLKPGLSFVFINRFLFPLSAPVSMEGENLMIPLEDFCAVFDVELNFLPEKKQCLKYGEKTYTAYETEKDGVLLLNLTEAAAAFGLGLFSQGGFYAVGEDLDKFPRPEIKFSNARVRGKKNGEIYVTYWNEEIARPVPLRLYLPTSISHGKKMKLLLQLHGGNPRRFDSAFVEEGLSFGGEEYGYIIAAIDVMMRMTAYGNYYPIRGAVSDDRLNFDEPENPMGYTDKQLEARRLAFKNVGDVLEQLEKSLPVDTENIFITGNSMGGEGTLFVVCNYPNVFRAACMAGASIDTRFFDASKSRPVPILFVAGTEDMHGFDFLEESFEVMKKQGANISFRVIGGGTHQNAWRRAIPGMFEWFEKISRKTE